MHAPQEVSNAFILFTLGTGKSTFQAIVRLIGLRHEEGLEFAALAAGAVEVSGLARFACPVSLLHVLVEAGNSTAGGRVELDQLCQRHAFLTYNTQRDDDDEEYVKETVEKEAGVPSPPDEVDGLLLEAAVRPDAALEVDPGRTAMQKSS